jgi:hypothetical protein
MEDLQVERLRLRLRLPLLVLGAVVGGGNTGYAVLCGERQARSSTRST